jgi:aspartate/methionine/tyrosine aminotransferase
LTAAIDCRSLRQLRLPTRIGQGGAITKPKWVAAHLEKLPRVGSRVTEELADRLTTSGVDVLRLHAHPHRQLPEHVADAAHRAARDNRVAPSRGLFELREALAASIGRELGRSIDPDQEVLITSGGMQALDLVCGATLCAGDEVLVSAPGFFLEGLVEPRGARLVLVPAPFETGFAPDWSALERAVTAATRLLLIITPGNPTGHVYSAADIERLADLAEQHNLLVVSDESYDRLVYDGAHHLSPCAHPVLAQRSVLIRSFTKSFAMPGWRVGYLIGPSPLIDGCLKLLEWTALYGSAVPQAAAAAAFSGPLDWLRDVVSEFQEHRDRLVRALHETGLPTLRPRGGPFVFPRVAEYGPDLRVADRLLREFGIAAVGGTLLHGPGYVRIPIGGSADTIDRLVERLQTAFAGVGAGAALR